MAPVLDKPSEQAIKGMPIIQIYLHKRNDVNLNPMIVGTIYDPNFVIRDKGELEHQANIIKVNDTFKIFYQFVSGKEESQCCTIAYNSEGTVINNSTFAAGHR